MWPKTCTRMGQPKQPQPPYSVRSSYGPTSYGTTDRLVVRPPLINSQSRLVFRLGFCLEKFSYTATFICLRSQRLVRPSRHSIGTPSCEINPIQHIRNFEIAWLLFSCMFFDLLAGKILHGQVDRAVGSVDNIVELVQRLPWISVVYGPPCTVGSRIVRVKSHKIVVISLSSKDRAPVHIKFTTVPKVVIYFLILTEFMRFSVEFCVVKFSCFG